MNDRLPRLKPNPLPAIHPVPEYLANNRLKAVYEETKKTLQVPWMGVVTMAFAHYPTFFASLWGGLKELAASREFIEACFDLRKYTESAVEKLEPRCILETLVGKGYAAREIEDIRTMNNIFSHGNQPYLMIATAARLLLEGYQLEESRSVTANNAWYGPSADNRLLLMEAHHVDAPTQEIYESMKSSLGLPFVNTDYRAFARWPSYLATAWNELSEKVPTKTYESQVAAVHDFAVGRMRDLPNPSGITAKELNHAASLDGSRDEILDVVRLFQWLLPGLVMNVAYFRKQLYEHPHNNDT